jgi:zinc/manganese transport system substrate-binding protein
VAKIIAQIRREKIPAVFVENITDPRLMSEIARETGATIGGTLYSDALSPPGGPAANYIEMMRHNLRELTKALAG